METALSQSGSAPAGEPTNAAPAASTARDPPSLVPPEAVPDGRTDDFGEAPVTIVSGNLAEDGAGGLATRAAALLDAGAADAWLTSRAGGSSQVSQVSQVSQTASPHEGSASPRVSTSDVSTPAPGRLISDASPKTGGKDAFSSPLTPAERLASDPTRIRALATRASAEMATLRGELRSERALAKTYAAELGRLRASAESRVAAGVAAVASAADSARGAAAVRADVIARATAAEGHAAAFYRRATEAERIARVERDRNASLVAALNAAGAAAAAATRALVERAEKAEALVEALELRVSDAEARADEAVGIARAATRNAADTARVASLNSETLGNEKENAAKRENRAFKNKRAVFAASSGGSTKNLDTPRTSEKTSRGLEETPKKTRPKTFTSESAARAASPGRRCAACAARASSAEVFPRSACVACDEKKSTSSSRAIRLEVSVPTAAGAAWTGTPRSPDRVYPKPGDGDDERDEPAERPAEASEARETAEGEARLTEARLTEARLASLEGRMALAAAELARDHSRGHSRNARPELPDALLESSRDSNQSGGGSPGAENRRRRRRERAEVAAKLDATEARLSAMRLEDARRAEAKAAEV